MAIAQRDFIGKKLVPKPFLVETNSPMKEIAALCGFCNAGHFTNTFRKATGVTPKSWRHPT